MDTNIEEITMEKVSAIEANINNILGNVFLIIAIVILVVLILGKIVIHFNKNFLRKIDRYLDSKTIYDIIIGTISLIVLGAILILYKNDISFKKIAYDNFSTILFGLFASILVLFAFLLNNRKKIKLEDSKKQIIDFKKVKEYYPFNKNMTVFKDAENETIIPTIEYENKKKLNYKFKLSKNKYYSLPEDIAVHSNELLDAYTSTNKYNRLTIRLDDFKLRRNTATIYYSYTTYFNTLMTNRAIDYPLSNGMTIREMYEYGPKISELKDSKLSNHIGFNGFIELDDGSVIFVKRNKNLSTNKGLWQPSISGSLKAEFCLDENMKMTESLINNAIYHEILDELKIGDDFGNKKDNEYTNNIIGFYRDLVEGGKPHFVFYYRFNKSFDVVKDNFIEKCKEEAEEDNKRSKIDGRKIKAFDVKDLKEAKLKNNKLKISKAKYETSASYLCALKIYLDFKNAK